MAPYRPHRVFAASRDSNTIDMLVKVIFICECLIWIVTCDALGSTSESLLVLSASLTGSITGSSEASVPTGSYESLSSILTISTTSGVLGSIGNVFTSIAAGNTTLISTTTTNVISSSSQLILQGSVTTTSAGNSSNTIATSTSSSSQPANTQPCNNFPEFCLRQYSNITEVSAHNSPFVVPNNVASNQALPVTTQLNDGIRMLQGQMHFVNATPHFCHTSCDLLDAGPITTYLTNVYDWVATHPYDIVTILLENGDYRPVTDYVPFIESTGLVKFAFTPPTIPLAKEDWPTLATMILAGKRVVFFMDYDANQGAVPWILDEFSHVWETTFDQTNRSFPCTPQRPPGLNEIDSKDRMYLTNHNLNYEIDLLGNSLLVPYLPLLNVTNNVSGFGSLGQGAQDCTDLWGSPPKFLNVDYYNDPNGSVFEVAAKWNGVTYNRTCCGSVTSGTERRKSSGHRAITVGFVVVLMTCTVF